MDETPLYLRMLPSTLLKKIESKRVEIKTKGQENFGETAILTIFRSEQKLPPLLTFEAQEGKHSKMTSRNKEWKSKRVFTY